MKVITIEGKRIGNVSSQFGLHQVIDESTDKLDSSSSCIDLILNSQPNLITESGVHPYLYTNFLHQIIFVKFNLEILHPPPYFLDIWQ